MVYLADSLEHVSNGVAVGDISFEIAPTVPNLKEFAFRQQGGDDRFAYRTGGADRSSLFSPLASGHSISSFFGSELPDHFETTRPV